MKMNTIKQQNRNTSVGGIAIGIHEIVTLLLPSTAVNQFVK